MLGGGQKLTETNTIVGIDVGTTKVCALVGETSEDGQLRIIGVGVTPSRGLRKGVVVNVHEATEAIAAAVHKAERISGYEIASAYVGVGGGHISAINSRGGGIRARRGARQSDIERALDAARAIAIPQNRRSFTPSPRFTVDGRRRQDPIGMQGIRLRWRHICTGASTSVSNLSSVCAMRASRSTI